MTSVSWDRYPVHAPDPYSMSNTVPFTAYEEDASASYLGCFLQLELEQSLEATQRLAEPVSKMTSKDWAGEPSSMAP